MSTSVPSPLSATPSSLLAAIVASSHDAILSKTLDGVITSWNAAAEAIFGWRADEAVGRPITLLVPPERLDEERGIVESVGRGERVIGLETVRLTKDGRRLDIAVTVSPVRDGAGRVVGASSIVRDLTEHRRLHILRLQAEQQAHAAHDLLQLITDQVPSLIAYIDRDLRYRLNNRAYETWFGHPRSEITGRRMPDVLGEAAWQHLRPHVERALAGETVCFEDRVPYRDAGERWIEASYVPQRGADGAVEGFAVFVHDVTQRRRDAEELRRLNGELAHSHRRKDEFIATLAHELRNPLAPIRNALDVLRLREPDAERMRWACGLIDRQVHQLTRLVDDLMDAGRIAGAKVELRLQDVALADIVRTAVEGARPAIDASGHRLDVRLPETAPRLRVDPARLTQVLNNLLVNAAKFTPDGGRIALEAAEGPAGLELRVRDNGIGIAPEQMSLLFELFSQAGSPLDKSRGGLGIGLALARGFVELHGGSLVAESDGPGLGAEFVVRLPSTAIAPPASPPLPATAPAAVPARRVLVADDNTDSAESLRMLLQLAGHEVRVASDGERALELLHEFRPEVAVLDIGMPRLDGYAIARRVRAQPWAAGLTLVALSGWGSTADKQRAREAGFDTHLTKPLDPAELDALLLARRSDLR